MKCQKHDQQEEKSRPKNIRIFINRKPYVLEGRTQSGAELKTLAGIPPRDDLFLQRRGKDLLIPNDQELKLKNGDHLHSQPAADYGKLEAWSKELDVEAERLQYTAQGGRGGILTLSGYRLPEGYDRKEVDLLVKIPALFPEAAPDMFWVSPSLCLTGGGLPKATSQENLLGKGWQRFSWHLSPGAWVSGQSNLRDFFRAIRSRLLRRN